MLLTLLQMMETLGLDVGDMIQIRTTSLELAQMVKLQPQSVNFLEISDPKAVLERAFRNFAALTKGDVFNFEYNDEVYHVAVLDVKPVTDRMGVSMIETDVSVEFAPPVGYVEPEKRPETGTSSHPGRGLPAGGVLHPQGTMAQAINYSAIAPSATSSSTNFIGQGQRVAKKAGRNTASPATPVPFDAVSSSTKRRTGAPAALRLPPNKLFFGYELKPLKSDKDKARERDTAGRNVFAGQGRNLRGTAKRKGENDEDEEKPKAPEKKGSGEGHRLDGRRPK